MLACWKENPSSRPSFIQLRAKFDNMLAKQRNASELYIELQTGAESEPCHESEVAKFTDYRTMEVATFESKSCQILYPSDDNDNANNRYIDTPSREGLSPMLDVAALPHVQFLSLPSHGASYLESDSALSPNFSSLHTLWKAEEISDEFPIFNNNS